MKKNTQKILLSFFSYQDKDAPQVFRSYEYLYTVFPDLSSGGIRATLKKLHDTGFVQRLSLGNKTFFCLTQQGRYQVQNSYPILKRLKRSLNNSLHLIICSHSPKDDIHFYRLRQMLEPYRPIKLTRGVYLLKEAPSRELMQNFLRKYSTSVSVLEIKQVVFGELSASFSKVTMLSDKKVDPSEISSRIDKLIDAFNVGKRSKDQFKNKICSCFYHLEKELSQLSLVDFVNDDIPQLMQENFQKWEKFCDSYFK